MNLKITKIILFNLCFITSISIGYTQSPRTNYELIEFNSFSENYTKYGLEVFWKEMYSDFKFKEEARENMASGVINVCIIFNEVGAIEIYSDNHLGYSIDKELKRILQKSLLNIKSTTKNIMAIAKFGFCENDELKESKPLGNCHLIFVYTVKDKFTKE